MRDDLISRQAAIDALNKLKIYRPLDSDRYVISDCLNKIVNLPSAQPEPLDEWCTDCKEYDHERHYCPKFCDVIRKTVEETKQERTGRWIIKDNPGTGWYRITCSECGEDVTSTAPCIGFYPNAKVMWNYCPNCGAKMEEGEEN